MVLALACCIGDSHQDMVVLRWGWVFASPVRFLGLMLSVVAP